MNFERIFAKGQNTQFIETIENCDFWMIFSFLLKHFRANMASSMELAVSTTLYPTPIPQHLLTSLQIGSISDSFDSIYNIEYTYTQQQQQQEHHHGNGNGLEFAGRHGMDQRTATVAVPNQ